MSHGETDRRVDPSGRLGTLLGQARHALRIARWEVSSGAGGMDRRALLAAILIVLALGGVGAGVALTGTAQDANIYRVGVDQSSPYYEAVASDPRFRITDPSVEALSERRIEVLISEGVVQAYDTRKGRAAAAAVKEAVQTYNERLMQREANRGNAVAAFPVQVNLRYVERDAIEVDGVGSSGSQNGGGSDGGGNGSDATGTPTATPSTAPTAGSGGGGGPGFGIPSFGADALFGTSSGTPSDIRPPFPFTSLVLAFAFVVPMNFVIQAYASSVLHERTNRRGELMLIAPVSPATIVAGKTLPYFGAMIGIAGLTAFALGGGLVSLGAVVPIALLFLACAFVGALLSRSHKELTFVLVTVSVVVTTYVFVPAIFTDVHPIAAISPLTIVVRQLEGGAIAPSTFAFATGPMLLASLVLFGLGGGLYREEDLFAQRPIPEKVLDALAGPIRGTKSVAGLTALLLPFVLLAELLAVAVLFIVPLKIALPVLLAILATIEEVGKSIHVLAGFERARYDRSFRTALAVGAASGVGFFLAEKLAVAAQLVGLPELDIGRAAFQLAAGTGGSDSPLILLALLLAPLALHVVTAAISAVGASRSRMGYLGGLLVAVLVHTLYNVTVVTAFVG